MTDNIPIDNKNPIAQLWDERLEQGLIGTLLIDLDTQRLEEIDPAWFYLHKHRRIIETMKSNPQAAGNIETLADELKRAGYLNDIGGPAYLVKLTACFAGSQVLEEYTNRIHDYSNRRRIVEIASQLVRKGCDLKEPTSETIGNAFTALDNLATIQGRGAIHWAQSLSRLYDHVEQKMENPADVFGMPVGLTDFDHLTGGLEFGTTTLVAGSPAMGKSILAMQFGLMSVLVGNQPGVALYSLEMREIQLMMRSISALAKIATHKMKTGRMDGDEWSVFAQTVAEAEAMPVYVYPNVELTTDDLRADLKRLKAKHGVSVYVLDYLHLMTDDIKGVKEDERSKILSRKLTTITKDLGMIGIIIDSVTKEGMDDSREPNLKTLRGSGQVGFDADNVFYIRQSPLFPDFRDLYLLKGREIVASGKAKITLRKNPEYPLFENALVQDINRMANNGRK